MTTHVKARYTNGVLTPLEPLELEEGAEVTVLVDERPADGAIAPASRQGSGSIVEMVDRLREKYPPDPWDDLPVDLVKNKKHYLYGHPREED